MKKTGFLLDKRYLEHQTGQYHPEMPSRLVQVFKGLSEAKLIPKLSIIPAKPANQMWIETVHDIHYIMRFEEACLSGFTEFDSADNQMCSESYDIALLAVGGVLQTVDKLMEGEIDNAFCAVRPPGHHAERAKAMGFCYFNNIAIAAKYLQEKWKIKNVGIIDIDVHHGNGTQHMFENDPTVFYYSIHQHPSFAYPGTGREFEEGAGNGLGFTKNSPMLPGQGDKDYKATLEKDLFPAFDAFKPEVILLSTGFDAHQDDEMADMNVTTEGYSWMMKRIVEMAGRLTDGKLISILEGGYSLTRLPELAKNHVDILMNHS